MTEDEAQAEVLRRRREDPQDGWFARAGAAGWQIVRLPGLGRGGTHAAVESRPRPPQADDPRSAQERTIGGPYIAGG